MDFFRKNPSSILWATQIVLLLILLINISQALNAHSKNLKHIMLLNSIDALVQQAQHLEQQASEDLSFQSVALKRFSTQFIDKLSQLENGSTDHALSGLSTEHQPLLSELLSKATPILQWVNEQEVDYRFQQQRQSKYRDHYAKAQEIQTTLQKLTASDLLDQLSTYQVMVIYRIHARFLQHINTFEKQKQKLQGRQDSATDSNFSQLDNDLQQLVHGEKQVKNLVFRRTLANLKENVATYFEELKLISTQDIKSDTKLAKHTSLDSFLHAFTISSQKLALSLNNQNGQGSGFYIYLMLVLLATIPPIYKRWVEPRMQQQDSTPLAQDDLYEHSNNLMRQDLSELKRARNQLINEIRSLNQGLLYIEASTQYEKTQDIANAYNEGIRCIVTKIDLFKKTFSELSNSLEPILTANMTASAYGANTQHLVELPALQPEMLESMKALESVKEHLNEIPGRSTPALDNKLNECIINHYNLIFKLKAIEESSIGVAETAEPNLNDLQRISNIKNQLVLMENVLHTLKVSNSNPAYSETSRDLQNEAQDKFHLVTV